MPPTPQLVDNSVSLRKPDDQHEQQGESRAFVGARCPDARQDSRDGGRTGARLARPCRGQRSGAPVAESFTRALPLVALITVAPAVYPGNPL